MTVATPPDAFVSAITQVLKPLVRALVANGLTYPYLMRLLKKLFVEVAGENFEVEGKKMTDSRISLLTGVHRKDVKVLRNHVGERFQPPASVSIGARVVNRWINDPRFTDADGHSRPLHRSDPDENGICFETLVDTVSKDLHSRTVLDELQRLGVLDIGRDNFVRLNAEAFVPREAGEDLYYVFGVNLSDHMAAATHNLMGEKPAFLNLAVQYDELTSDSVETLREAARHHGLDAIRTINRQGLELKESHIADAGTTHRIRFGVYFYCEPSTGAPDQDQTS